MGEMQIWEDRGLEVGVAEASATLKTPVSVLHFCLLVVRKNKRRRAGCTIGASGKDARHDLLFSGRRVAHVAQDEGRRSREDESPFVYSVAVRYYYTGHIYLSLRSRMYPEISQVRETKGSCLYHITIIKKGKGGSSE